MLGGSDQIVAALAHLSGYNESHHVNKEEEPRVTIAISRQAGSRGPQIAQAAGARLGWPVYDHELLTRIAEEKGLSRRLLEHLDERRVHWLEQIIAGLSTKTTSPTEGTYLKQLLELVVTLGQVGHCIIVGRGAAYVLPAATTVRVHVVAAHALRVSNVERSQGVSRAEAERWVDKTDAERESFVRSHFHHDFRDLLNHDLVLNAGRYGIDDCADMIVLATRLREAQVKAPEH